MLAGLNAIINENYSHLQLDSGKISSVELFFIYLSMYIGPLAIQDYVCP